MLVDAFSRDEFVRAWVAFQLKGAGSAADSKQLRAGRSDPGLQGRGGRDLADPARRY